MILDETPREDVDICGVCDSVYCCEYSDDDDNVAYSAAKENMPVKPMAATNRINNITYRRDRRTRAKRRSTRGRRTTNAG